MRTASDIASAFLIEHEGYSPKPYKDTTGRWTIGNGSTLLPDGTPVNADTPPIDKNTAISYMEYHINKEVLPFVSRIRNWDRLNVNQQAACISLAYNIGGPAFLNASSVAKAIEAWNIARVPADFMLWDKERIDGKLVSTKGMRNRRLAETKLFLTPVSKSSIGV